jgi:hypothetical protein
MGYGLSNPSGIGPMSSPSGRGGKNTRPASSGVERVLDTPSGEPSIITIMAIKRAAGLVLSLG